MSASLSGLARIAILAVLAATAPAVAADCGGSVACAVPGGEYRIAFPPSGEATGVLVFFHGHRGSAESQMKARSLVEAAARHGLAFAAPDGLGGSWSHRGSPSARRDEAAFVGAVLDDLDARFGFGEGEVLAGGFSSGASMAYDALCEHAGRFAGAVTFAGVFWQPLRTAAECAGLPPLVHIHGRSDKTFPLEGRPIGDRARQGDTFRTLQIVREGAACTGDAPAPVIAGMDCTVSEGCSRGSIALCLHPGGHEVRGEWLDEALTALGR